MVVMERTEPSTSCSTRRCSCSSVSDMWKRSFRPRMVLLPWKQASWEPVGRRKRDLRVADKVTGRGKCMGRGFTLLHDLHYLHHLVHVLPGGQQTLQHQHLVVEEHVAIDSTHYLWGKRSGRRGQTGMVLTQKLSFSLTSTNSGVSLNAEVSKPRFLGDDDKMKPKSMWMM